MHAAVQQCGDTADAACAPEPPGGPDRVHHGAGGQDDTNGTYVCLCLACAPPLSDAMLCYRVRARIH